MIISYLCKFFDINIFSGYVLRALGAPALNPFIRTIQWPSRW